MTDTGGVPRKLIFAAEDDEEQLMMLRLILNSAGFDVVTESNADHVLKKAESLQPDIILLDVMMPSVQGLDGFQLCERIREHPQLKTVPVIIVSAIAQGMGEMREKVRTQVGADEFLMKPYNPADLVERVRRLTGG